MSFKNKVCLKSPSKYMTLLQCCIFDEELRCLQPNIDLVSTWFYKCRFNVNQSRKEFLYYKTKMQYLASVKIFCFSYSTLPYKSINM